MNEITADPNFLSSGFEVLHGVLDSDQLNKIDTELGAIALSKNRGGIRHADKKFPVIGSFVLSEPALSLAQRYLPGLPRLVRAILFNKTPQNNWRVSWHQDKTIVVGRKFDKPGWGPWSTKEGSLHVQPPVDVLNQTITVRIHLDPATLDNGCLSVIPGSHLSGILSEHEISMLIKNNDAVACTAPAGSALLMRPHLLHCSAKGLAPSCRRVLHIEYTSHELAA